MLWNISNWSSNVYWDIKMNHINPKNSGILVTYNKLHFSEIFIEIRFNWFLLIANKVSM